MYLCIKNKGECPVEGFTMLGVSTSRGQSSKIGQFGTGATHGILACLREGLNPLIWTGKNRVEFFSEPALMGDHSYGKIFAKIGNKAPRELSISLEFGAIDWTSMDMALREFVSNALDNVDGDMRDIEFRIMERPRPEEGYTMVCIPLTPAVQAYYNKLKQNFLHFRHDAPQNMGEECILDKDVAGPALVYRKGVIVRALAEYNGNSLYNYNFGDGLRVDDCRNIDDYAAKSAIAGSVARSNRLHDIMDGVHKTPTCMEGRLGGWDLKYTAKNNAELWLKSFEKAFGTNAVVSMDELSTFNEGAVRKGFRVINLPEGWYTACKEAGVVTALEKCDNLDESGNELLDPTPEVLATRDRVWDWIALVGLTNGKSKPPVRMFKTIMQAGSETLGYYQPKDKTVYIGVDYPSNTKVMLEELAHYITGANDCTRDFQDFSFRFAAEMATLAGG